MWLPAVARTEFGLTRAYRQLLEVHTPARRTTAAALAAVLVLSVEAVYLAPAIGRAASELSRIQLGWLAAAIGCEWVSMVSFARLQRIMLSAAGLHIRLRSVIATVLAGNAISVTLPGGSIASVVYTARRFRSFGASRSLIGFSLVVTGLLSSLALAGLAATGGALHGDFGQVGSGLAEVAAIAALSVGVIATIRRPRLLRRLTEPCLRGWLKLRPGSAVRYRAEALIMELRDVNPAMRVWVRGIGFAFANWAADLLCLLVACRAVGVHTSIDTMVIAYAIGMAAASTTPFLPAGLGVVDAALVLALRSGGVPAGAAVAADLAYRSVSFGLIAIIGWGVYALQRRGPRPRTGQLDSDAT